MHRSLAVIFYGGNNAAQTEVAVKYAFENSDQFKTKIYVIDNGSEIPYSTYEWSKYCQIIRYEKNIGGNAVFHRWMIDDWFGNNVPDYMAFLHCDLFIREKDWDAKIISAFQNYPLLCLQGFVGSTEIDERGGRGTGTMLNYLGRKYGPAGAGSPAEMHGRREQGLTAAAMLDHCSMIFRTSHLRELTPQEGNFAPEHFYDRHVCCETLKMGKWVAVNGISCDHTSGGVGGGTIDAATLCREFLDGRGIPYDKDQERSVTYVESEKDFHRLYFHTDFIPLRVAVGHEVFHQHISKGGFWHANWNPSHGRNRVDGR